MGKELTKSIMIRFNTLSLRNIISTLGGKLPTAYWCNGTRNSNNTWIGELTELDIKNTVENVHHLVVVCLYRSKYYFNS